MLHRFRPSRRRFLQQSTTAGLGLSLLPRLTLAQEPNQLNFYNWDTYIGEDTLANFKDATGIEVTMDLFADNEELFAKLRGGNPGYDVIVPTNDFVERMIQADMLMPLDRSKIPNFANLSPTFQKAEFDPGRQHSMPYMWGTIGIGYRKSRVDGVPDSWKWLLDSDQYSGRIALLGEARAIFQSAFKYLGASLNSTDEALLKRAEEMLIAQKPHIKAFAEDNGQDLLLSGEVDLTMEWSGDILQVMAEDDDLGYVIPQEGGELWQDCLAIPKGAPHPDNAHRFINYLLDAQVGAEIADFIRYGTPNAAALEHLPADYRNNPAIFPSDEVLERCEVSVFKGPDFQRLLDEAWTRVQAA
ncbi:MAG: PotD/PotF family extracellular solute-binding protein [Candidatus Competibacterales bacterium]